MKPELLNKIKNIVKRSYPTLAGKILKEVENDLVLKMYEMRANTRVTIKTTQNDIFLEVGHRDFQFDRLTGECIGAGMVLGN